MRLREDAVSRGRRYSWTRHGEPCAGWAHFTARALCFYYVAEGSNFLKRGSTHPPSFRMFHSPRVENGVRLKQMSSKLLKEIFKCITLFLTSRVGVRNWKQAEAIFLSALDAFTANYSDTLTEQRSTALFQVLSWTLKLANGCSTASHK